jgi:hypothetical protein
MLAGKDASAFQSHQLVKKEEIVLDISEGEEGTQLIANADVNSKMNNELNKHTKNLDLRNEIIAMGFNMKAKKSTLSLE